MLFDECEFDFPDDMRRLLNLLEMDYYWDIKDYVYRPWDNDKEYE
jgi:hypothetical protein